MNGIFNVLKPPGMTSFDVVARIRGLLRTKKAGHAGTLDPLAVGVLPVCVGSATKAIEFMMDKDKLYRAELTLGIVTDTQDASGSVLSRQSTAFPEKAVEAAIESFKGKSMQLPPMYSAVKVGGSRLYDLAREGVVVDRTPREIEIYSVNVVDIKPGENMKVLFDIHCSKGTYIRTLCADIGDRLGCGGHMSFLLRRKAGCFGLSSAHTLGEIKMSVDEGEPFRLMTETDRVFTGYGEFHIDGLQEKKLREGQTFAVPQGFESEGMVRIYDGARRFIALGEIFKMNGGLFLKSRKFFCI